MIDHLPTLVYIGWHLDYHLPTTIPVNLTCGKFCPYSDKFKHVQICNHTSHAWKRATCYKDSLPHASLKILFACKCCTCANVHLQLILCKQGLSHQMDKFFNGQHLEGKDSTVESWFKILTCKFINIQHFLASLFFSTQIILWWNIIWLTKEKLGFLELRFDCIDKKKNKW